jgi:hypothetical protein
VLGTTVANLKLNRNEINPVMCALHCPKGEILLFHFKETATGELQVAGVNTL